MDSHHRAFAAGGLLRAQGTVHGYDRYMDKVQRRRWYVVADGARARIVAINGRNVIAPLGEQFVGANLKSREILADRPGRGHESRGAIRHAKEPPTDPHRKVKADFARDLAEVLEHELSTHKYDELVLVAAPQTLGDLRSSLPETVRRRVVAEIDKDITHVPDHELPERLTRLTSESE
jgi:protein required for attachment to host cells